MNSTKSREAIYGGRVIGANQSIMRNGQWRLPARGGM